MTLTTTYSVGTSKSTFQTNTVTPSSQNQPDVLGLANGGFVEAYVAGGELRLDFYDATGNTVVGAGRDPDDVAPNNSSQTQPQMAQLADGNVVVVWWDLGSNNYGLRGHIYSSAGTPIGTEFALTPPTTDSSKYRNPEIAALTNGDFVVSYTVDRSHVEVSHYSAAGALRGTNVVNPESGTGDASVAALAGGGYVVTYTDVRDVTEKNVRGVIYNNDGSVRNPNVEIATNFTDQERSNVVGLPDGNFAVVFDSDHGAGPMSLKVFSPDGTTNSGVTGSSVAYVPTDIAENNPEITVLENGFILVSWVHQTTPSNREIHGRIFTASGVPVLVNGTTEPLLLASTAANETEPSVAGLLDGRFIASWRDTTSDGDGDRISSTIQAISRTVTGDAANDTHRGDELGERFTGGAGDDTFVYKRGGGADTWSDFTAGAGTADKIDLTDFTNVRNLSEVLARTSQFTLLGSTFSVIDFGNGDTVALNGVTRASLHANDFIFAPPDKDFAFDHRSDILWRNADGRVSLWDNGTLAGAHIIAGPGAMSSAWQVEGTGDFNEDNIIDILWRNDDGSVLTWYAGNPNWTAVAAGPGVIPNAWQIVGTGDFDGNGRSDILWRHDNGAVSIWDDGNIAKAHFIAQPGVVPAGWQIVGTGDFDGNGQSDILWRHDNGSVSIWDNGAITGAHIVAGPGVGGGPIPATWQIAGTGDFNSNGRDDILWRRSDGAVSIWDDGQVSGAHIIAGPGVGGGSIPNSWHIEDVADYAGDGIDDILWRNDDGRVSIWDNGTVAGAHIIANAGQVPGGWEIV